MLSRNNLGIVIVDMQGNYVDRLNQRRIGEIIERHIQLLECARVHNVPLLFFEDKSKDSTIEEITSKIDGMRYLFLRKRKWSGFDLGNRYKIRPERWLRDNGAENIFVTGIFASCCVFCTGIGAKSYGFGVASVLELIYYEGTSRDIVENYRAINFPIVSYDEVIRCLS